MFKLLKYVISFTEDLGMTKNHQSADAAVTELCNAIFFLNSIYRKESYGQAI